MFNVINFYEINIAGNAVVDEVILNIGITKSMITLIEDT